MAINFGRCEVVNDYKIGAFHVCRFTFHAPAILSTELTPFHSVAGLLIHPPASDPPPPDNDPINTGHYPLSVINYPLNGGTCHGVKTALKNERDEDSEGGDGEDGEKSDN